MVAEPSKAADDHKPACRQDGSLKLSVLQLKARRRLIRLWQTRRWQQQSRNATAAPGRLVSREPPQSWLWPMHKH